jgi:hypothetical protein
MKITSRKILVLFAMVLLFSSCCHGSDHLSKMPVWEVPYGVTNIWISPLNDGAEASLEMHPVYEGEKIPVIPDAPRGKSAANHGIAAPINIMFLRIPKIGGLHVGKGDPVKSKTRCFLRGINGSLFPENSPVYFLSTKSQGSGSGSVASPLDASNRKKFDSIVPSLPQNSTIFLLPGFYVTDGVRLPPRCSLLGCGPNCTVLRLVSLCSENHVTVEIMGSGKGIRVAGLKVDGNWKALAKHGRKMACIVLIGDDDVIENNWITNFGGDGDTGQEGFPVQIAGHHACIRWNKVTDPEPGASAYVYSSMLWIGGVAGSSGKIEGNTVIGGAMKSAGFGVVGGDNFDGVEVTGNWFENLVEGIHGDTWHGKNLTISGNRFVNCTRGIGLDFSGTNTLTGVIISWNVFDLPKERSLKWSGSAVRATGVSNIVVQGNTVSESCGLLLDRNV